MILTSIHSFNKGSLAVFPGRGSKLQIADVYQGMPVRSSPVKRQGWKLEALLQGCIYMHSWPSGWWRARRACRDVPGWGERARTSHPVSYSHWTWATLSRGAELDLGYLCSQGTTVLTAEGYWRYHSQSLGPQVPLWNRVRVHLHAHHTFSIKDKEWQ